MTGVRVFRALAVLFAALVLLVPAGGIARAAELKVEATVDLTSIPIDGQVAYTITLSGGVRQLPTPNLPALEQDWTVYSGGTSRNFSFVNGQIASSASFRYVLTPKRPGKLVIGRTTVKVGNQVYQTDPVTVTVSATPGGTSGRGGTAAPPGRARPTDREAAGQAGRDLFVTASVDKKEPYVQEQIVLTFRFYQRITLLESPGFQKPTTTGFWSEDLPPQRTFTEVLDGRRYHVTEIRTALFPTSPGEYEIGPATLECTVPEVQRVIDNDPFSMFGRSVFGSKKLTLKSDPIKIRVKPLPDGAPKEFAGAVGTFDLEARVDKTTVPQGEPVTLTVTVSGTGNLKTVPDPSVPSLPELKAYDSSSASDVDVSGDQVRGSRTSQLVLVPLKAGAVTIPPITLAWFDPKAGAYQSVRSAPIPLTVTPGNVTAGGALGGGGRGAIEVVGQDIRFLRTELSGVSTRGRRPWDSPLFWFFQLLPVALVAGSIVHERRQRRLAHDIGFARQVRSGREANRRLRKARELAARNDDGLFGEIAAAVQGYVADKLNRSAAGLTHDEVRALLEERKVPAELVGRLLDLLGRCDMARFTPSATDAASRQRLLDDAGAIIESLRKGGL